MQETQSLAAGQSKAQTNWGGLAGTSRCPWVVEQVF